MPVSVIYEQRVDIQCFSVARVAIDDLVRISDDVTASAPCRGASKRVMPREGSPSRAARWGAPKAGHPAIIRDLVFARRALQTGQRLLGCPLARAMTLGVRPEEGPASRSDSIVK